MGRYLEIAKRVALEAGRQNRVGHNRDFAKPERGDEYWRRAGEALRRIGRLKNLREALRFLERTRPARYRWLLNTLPDHLDMLWESGARLTQFQDALDRWVAAHESTVRDFLAAGETTQ